MASIPISMEPIIAIGFPIALADEPVGSEPVSEDKFPAEQGKYSDLGRKWPAPTPKIV